MVRVGVFASGNGSNFERLVQYQRENPKCNYSIELLITDKAGARASKRAENLGIKHIFVDPKKFQDKTAFENHIIELLKENGIELITLAGYMRIISPVLLNAFTQKIINIHPAYLPNFPGKDGIGDAFKAGVNETGVTIHYVDSGVDTGEIIYQEKISIDPLWTFDQLKENIHRLEHKIYPMILDRISKEL